MTAEVYGIVRLTPRSATVLRHLLPLRAAPDGYLLTNTLGRPVDQTNFYKIFCDAQRALGIRLRDL